MKSRVLFYALCAGLLVGTVYVSFHLFLGRDQMSESELPRDRSGGEKTSSKHSNMRLSKSTEQSSGLWNDPRLESAPSDSKSTEDLKSVKKLAEVENNINLLLGLYDQGQDQEFLSRLNDLIQKNPQAKEYIALRGDYFYNEQNWSEAEKSISQLVTMDPNNLFARTTRAEVLAIQGKTADALADFEDVVRRDPTNLDGLYGILSTHSMLGDGEVGEKRIEELYRANPNASTALAYADGLLSRGDKEGRRKIVQASLAQYPTDSNLLRAAAGDAARDGNHAAAISYYENAASNEKNVQSKIDIYFRMADSYHAKNENDRAMESLQKALESGADPESVESHRQAMTLPSQP